jgi:hypothetical protein
VSARISADRRLARDEVVAGLVVMNSLEFHSRARRLLENSPGLPTVRQPC